MNGVDLLLTLGLAPDPYGDPLPIAAFGGIVTAALRRHLGRRSPGLSFVCDQRPGAMPLVTCGRAAGYIEDRLGDLTRMVQRARAAAATHIHWT